MLMVDGVVDDMDGVVDDMDGVVDDMVGVVDGVVDDVGQQQHGNAEMHVGMPSASPSCSCWGGILKNLDGDGASLDQPPCQPGFVPGKRRLTDKFCSVCIRGFYVPYSHVRAMTPANAEKVGRPFALLPAACPASTHLGITHIGSLCVCSSSTLVRASGQAGRRVRASATGIAG